MAAEGRGAGGPDSEEESEAGDKQIKLWFTDRTCSHQGLQPLQAAETGAPGLVERWRVLPPWSCVAGTQRRSELRANALVTIPSLHREPRARKSGWLGAQH